MRITKLESKDNDLADSMSVRITIEIFRNDHGKFDFSGVQTAIEKAVDGLEEANG